MAGEVSAGWFSLASLVEKRRTACLLKSLSSALGPNGYYKVPTTNEDVFMLMKTTNGNIELATTLRQQGSLLQHFRPTKWTNVKECSMPQWFPTVQEVSGNVVKLRMSDVLRTLPLPGSSGNPNPSAGSSGNLSSTSSGNSAVPHSSPAKRLVPEKSSPEQLAPPQHHSEELALCIEQLLPASSPPKIRRVAETDVPLRRLIEGFRDAVGKAEDEAQRALKDAQQAAEMAARARAALFAMEQKVNQLMTDPCRSVKGGRSFLQRLDAGHKAEESALDSGVDIVHVLIKPKIEEDSEEEAVVIVNDSDTHGKSSKCSKLGENRKPQQLLEVASEGQSEASLASVRQDAVLRQEREFSAVKGGDFGPLEALDPLLMKLVDESGFIAWLFDEHSRVVLLNFLQLQKQALKFYPSAHYYFAKNRAEFSSLISTASPDKPAVLTEWLENRSHTIKVAMSEMPAGGASISPMPDIFRLADPGYGSKGCAILT